MTQKCKHKEHSASNVNRRQKLLSVDNKKQPKLFFYGPFSATSLVRQYQKVSHIPHPNPAYYPVIFIGHPIGWGLSADGRHLSVHLHVCRLPDPKS